MTFRFAFVRPQVAVWRIAALAAAAFAPVMMPAASVAAGPARAAPMPSIPFNSNFWSYWTHYWATWLPDHPVYEMIELTVYENPVDPDDRLIRVLLTERAAPKRQYFYLNDEAEVRRSRANTYLRVIEYRRSGPPGGPQNLEVSFTDKDGIPIRWTIAFPPEARLRNHGAGLTPSIHSVGSVLLFALRTRTVDTHIDRVMFGDVNYAFQGSASDATPGTRSWYNPDYYSAVLVHGRTTFTRTGNGLANSWGRAFGPIAENGQVYRSGELGPDNFITFRIGRNGSLRSYAHFSRGHSLNFSFRPGIPTLDRARDGQQLRFRVSFDQRRSLMEGTIRIHRQEPDTVVLEWVPTGPSWAIGRTFWSSLRRTASGYELVSTENRSALPGAP